jgi:plastocyanin
VVALRVRVFVMFALLIGVLVPATTASAATTYEVEIGRFLEGAPAESMRFLPGSIDVHRGDTLHFSSFGFHTATLLPVGTGPVEWFDTMAEPGTSDPYTIFQPDPDDGSYKFSVQALLPSSFTCGASAQPACTFDGSSLLNSGVPLDTGAALDFSTTVTAPRGSSFYVVCVIHGPKMRMEVNVVARSEPASDPADLAAANDAAIQQDTDSARALDEKFSALRTWHKRSDGSRVWDAWAGVENGHVALLAMYPRKLVLEKGDTVQWHFDSLNFEPHTATFPVDVGKEIVRGSFYPSCDPDGDAGPGPDNPPDLEAPPFCADPTQLELNLDPRFVPVDGNGTFRGADLESSGVRGLLSPLGDDNWDLTFTRSSGDEPFKYLCLIHPFMRGRVVVR